MLVLDSVAVWDKIEEPITVRVVIWTVKILLYLIFKSPKLVS
jgi:hypothetical protein